MVKLLVSVRNAAEAAQAIDGGADWIDAKEPAAGALGMPEPHELAGVVAQVAGRRPVSTALGELGDHGYGDRLGQLPWQGVSWAKVGLSGCGLHLDWPAKVQTLRDELPEQTSLVAVVYADHSTCDAPSPEEVLRVACDLGLRALLVDTYDKSSGGLFDWFSPERLRELFAAAHCAGMLTVAAGSLRAAEVPQAIAGGAEVIAVRGAACQQQRRDAPVCAKQVAQLRDRIPATNAEFS